MRQRSYRKFRQKSRLERKRSRRKKIPERYSCDKPPIYTLDHCQDVAAATTTGSTAAAANHKKTVAAAAAAGSFAAELLR